MKNDKLFFLTLLIGLIFLHCLSIYINNIYGKILFSYIQVQYCALRITVFLQRFVCILIDSSQYCSVQLKLLFFGEINICVCIILFIYC